MVENNKWKREIARIKQQEVAHFIAAPTFNCFALFLLILAFLLFVFGTALLGCAYGITRLAVRYDSECASKGTCTVSFTPESDLEDPKMYYRLEGFYANHKTFVGAKSASQLRGNTIDSTDACDPIETNGDVAADLASVTGATLDSGATAYPCGLPPKYVFTDTFALADGGGTAVSIDSSDIALSVDQDSRFENTDNLSRQWLNVESQSFMVWMQVETFPSFDKLYGEVKGTLKKGTSYTLTINNQYVYPAFDLEKYVVFSTTNGLGKNAFIGWVFIIADIYILLIMLPALTILEYLKVKGKLPWYTDDI